MAASGDFYQSLGVSPTASAAEIQRAYRELARQYHPDVNSDPSAEDRFKEIGEAYEVLSDPEKRRRYDAYGPDFRRVPEGAGAGPRGRRSTAGTRAGARTGAGPRTGSTAGGPDDEFWFRSDGAEVDLEDLFGGMFSGRRGWGPIRAPTKRRSSSYRSKTPTAAAAAR